MVSEDSSKSNFLILISSFVVFVSIFIVSFLKFPTNQDKKESVPLLSQAENSEGQVLGSYNTPKIIISGGDGYSSGGVISLASTDEPAVYIASYQYTGEAEISLFNADKQVLLDYLVHDSENKQLKKKPDIEKLSLVTALKQDIVSGYDKESKVILPLEENGIWFLLIKAGSSESYAFVVRSDFGVLAKQGDNKLIFWAQSFKTKRRIGGGSVKTYSLLDKKNVLEGANFDGDGIASISLNPGADIAIAEIEGKTSLLPINLRYMGYNYRTFRPNSTTRYFVFTDRLLYQPGDKIYFKSVLRDDDDARYAIPTGTAKVKIYKDWDEKNNVIFEDTFPITDKGSVFGEYKLPEDIQAGYYQLKVDTGKENSAYYWDSGNYLSFQVQNYRKPEYSLEVETNQKEITSGEKLVITLKGNYFSGQPVSGQEVKYSIFASDFYSFEYYSDYNYLGNSDFYWWGGMDTPVVQNTAVLNQKGEAKVEIEARDPKNSGKNKIFVISAEMDNGSGNPSFAKKNVLVYAGEFDIFRKSYGKAGKINEEMSIPLIIKPHYNAKIAGVPLKVKVRRENWVKYYDQNEKYPQYRKETEDLPEMSLKTDGNGEAVIRFTPAQVGSYIFTTGVLDDKNNLVSKSFYAWVTDKDYSFYSGQYQNQLTVKQDKEKYKPGEKIILSLFSEIPDRDVFLSFERGRIDRYQIVSLTGKSAVIESQITDSDQPNIYVSANSFSDFTLDEGLVNVLVSTEGKKIVVGLNTDEQKYGPSNSVSLNVQTNDVAGNPVSAEVAVWAIDKALFELADQKPANIFERFWSDRGDNTASSHSLEGIIVPTAEGGGCFSSDSLILMGNGKTKTISGVKKGEEILTRKNEKSSELVKARVTFVHSADVGGYLIINRKLKVTENHIMWVNSSWKEAGSIQIGDKLLDSNDKPIKVSSIEWVRGKFKVYNLEIEKYKTFFVNGIWVHNQKGGGEGRTIFKDTAYWNPAVQTDASGRAKVTFKLPDNLTTWVISGIAASSDTKAGQATKEIVVSKNVIVRPVLPNLIRIGDQFSVSALVQNFTGTDQNFVVGLNFDSGEIKEPKEGTLLVKTGETQTVSWWINPAKENPKAKFSFSAVSKENSEDFDKVTLEMPVLQFGFSEKKAQVGDGNKDYRVELSADADKEKSRAVLSLSPNLHGALLPAMRYLIHYPYGCTEQITSTFVPAVIVKERPNMFKGYLEGENLDENIRGAIKKLQAEQKPDGSFSWWGHRDSSAFVTAYVTEYVSRAKNLGFDDKGILEKAKNYLKSDSKDFGETVCKAYGLSFLGETKEINFTVSPESLTPDILAMAVMANLKNGRTSSQTNGLDSLVALSKKQGEGVYWTKGNRESFGSNEASSALAVRAMLAGGTERDLITKAIRFFIKSRQSEYWANSFATAQVVQAVTDFASTDNESTPDYTYTVSLDGKTLKSEKVNKTRQKIADIEIPLSKIKTGGSNLVVTKEGDGQIYSTLVIDQWRTDENAITESHGLTVEREYFDEDGNQYKTVGIGDEVTVKLTVSGLEAEDRYGVLVDELPSGLVPINETFKNEQYDQSGNRNYSYSVAEITKNGAVLSLYDILPGGNVYTYRARAVSAGTFLIPPAEVSLMYSPEVWGRTKAEKLEISDSRQVFPKPLTKQEMLKSKSNILLKVIFGAVALTGLVFLAVKVVKKKFTGKPPTPPSSEQTNTEPLS